MEEKTPEKSAPNSDAIFFIQYKKKELTVSIQHYHSPRRVALTVANEKGEPWGTLSTNLVDEDCGPYDFFAKEWSENREWAPYVLTEMVRQGLIKETGKTAESGRVVGIRQFAFITSSLIELIKRLKMNK